MHTQKAKWDDKLAFWLAIDQQIELDSNFSEKGIQVLLQFDFLEMLYFIFHVLYDYTNDYIFNRKIFERFVLIIRI